MDALTMVEDRVRDGVRTRSIDTVASIGGVTVEELSALDRALFSALGR